VTTAVIAKERKIGMTCQRCGGRMIFEKFYDVNNGFFRMALRNLRGNPGSGDSFASLEPRC